MSDDQDHFERGLDAPASDPSEAVQARRINAGWWIAAVMAVVAVAGAMFLLSNARPSPEKLQAAGDQRRAEAQIDDAAFGSQLAAAHAAKFAQAAAESKARDTETAAQAGASNADATARDASATAPAPP